MPLFKWLRSNLWILTGFLASGIAWYHWGKIEIVQQSDTSSYLEASQFILQGRLHPIRPIGIALLYAPFAQNSELFLRGGVCIHILLTTLAAFLFQKLTSPHGGLLFLILVAPIWNVLSIMSETGFMTLLLLGVYYLKSHKLLIALFIFSFSCLVRPGFIIPYLCLLLIILIQNFEWKYFLTTIPIMIQCALFYHQYELFKISVIDHYAINIYLSGKFHSFLKHTPLLESVMNRYKITEDMNRLQFAQETRNQIQFMMNRPDLIIKCLLHSLKDNTETGNSLIKSLETPLLYQISRWQNILFTCSLPLLLWSAWRSASYIWMVYLLTLLSVLTCSISFYQGDRFHWPFFPLIVMLWYWTNKHKFTRWVRSS